MSWPLATRHSFTITTIANMNRVSQMLTQASLDVPRTYATLAERGDVPLSTLHHRDKGRRSIEEKAQSQQYLTSDEEKAVIKFLLLMSNLEQSVRIKFIPSLVFYVARNRLKNKSIKPSSKNWARSFEKRHSELKAKTVKAIDWKRHGNNIYDKIVEWFKLIGKMLQDQDLAILPKNTYNMNETEVLLSMLGSIKVLVGKNDLRDYRGADVKRTMMTAVECISANGRRLLPLIIWPASTHRSNWTTYSTLEWHYEHSENEYNDFKISLKWFTRVFDLQIKERANQKSRVLIMNDFGTHETLEVLKFCFENNIILCRLPSHTISRNTHTSWCQIFIQLEGSRSTVWVAIEQRGSDICHTSSLSPLTFTIPTSRPSRLDVLISKKSLDISTTLFNPLHRYLLICIII